MQLVNPIIVTSSQMSAIEEKSVKLGISTDQLMENAGLNLAKTLRYQIGGSAGLKVLILVGPGNNGSDGLVMARYLAKWGSQVTVYLTAQRPDIDFKLISALEYGATSISYKDDPDCKKLYSSLKDCRIVVDSILGTGTSRPLEGRLKDIAITINHWRLRRSDNLIVSVDLPTGVNPDSGEADPASLAADYTWSLGFPKRGLFQFPGADYRGKLSVLDIGIPNGAVAGTDVGLQLLSPGWVGNTLPSRPLNSHKGTYGHTLIVAGSKNYIGAAYLSVQAAIRTGSGLVTVASPECIYPILASKLTEAIHMPLPDNAQGGISPEAVDSIRPHLNKYTALALGCGLGTSDGTREFVERLFCERPGLDIPLVLDADGLNNICTVQKWWEYLPSNTVLTPHPGEMERLSGVPVVSILKDKIGFTQARADCWNKIVILKGAHTIISAPDLNTSVSPFANPAMSSGGTGDVLTGIIASLISQGLSGSLAASCGVYMHGQAGVSAADQLGDTGLTATDITNELPKIIKSLRDIACAAGVSRNWVNSGLYNNRLT